MNKLKILRWVINIRAFCCLAFTVVMLLIAGCDNTDLTGEIKPSPVVVSVGENITLKLEVPENLEGINRETWTVEPQSIGSIEYAVSEENNREVIFTGLSSGSGTIEVWGYYKQTNPQYITEVDVTVK